MSARMSLRAIAVAAILSCVGAHPARAQNTYADVPFNQGSLFYRPSGAKPPQTTTSTRGRLFGRARGTSYPAQRYTYRPTYPPAAPGVPAYYYAQRPAPWPTRYDYARPR